MIPNSDFLHIHCGDSSAETLRKSGVPGDVIVWCDPVCEGPTPAGLPENEWVLTRAEYLASRIGNKAEECMEWLEAHNRALEEFPVYKEAVLWFDACLFDQAILIRQLSWFSRRDMVNTRLSLICAGEFPGFKKFKGLGELNPEQLASLLKTRHEVTKQETALASESWEAFCSPDYFGIEKIISKDTSSLPYLKDAFRRHLEQFPVMKNGLNRLETEILEVVSAGYSKFPAIFAKVSEKEERPFFGDTALWGFMRDISLCREPLVLLDDPGNSFFFQPEELAKQNVFITETGRDVLACRKNHIEINGINRWLGGVHLEK